jgi:hypothetical protein
MPLMSLMSRYVSLLVSLANCTTCHVCVPLRRRFVPDSRTPWMTVGLRNSIRERDAMNSRAPGFRAVKRRVSALIRTAAARLAERRFDPILPPRVLWSNFRSMGSCKNPYFECDSSDFSSFRISADDFADFFVIYLPLRLLSRLIRSDWMMRVFLFGMSMVMNVLPLLWASRRMLLVLTAFRLSFLGCYCLLSLIMFSMY